MSHLTVEQRSLVAIGASLASNCIPCVKFHIQKGLQAGLTDLMIREAVETAESVRQVPARNVREAAAASLQAAGGQAPGTSSACGTRDAAPVTNETSVSPCCGQESGP